eukprot:GGOE01013515.1.p1 GENE.GGOE01013515.1~~GGOE01013515.1.p1  ORF type:complete len:143 (-),score=12.87 GGOE01013515.1:379-807(-)
MAVLGEKAKEVYRNIVRNLWAYQSGFQKHHDLAKFDTSKVLSETPSRNTFPFRALYPTTTQATIRTLGSKARFALLGVALISIYKQDAHLRPTEGAFFDRVQRKGYVRLPDGRLAQVNPQIDTDLTPRGIWNTVKDTLNPVP